MAINFLSAFHELTQSFMDDRDTPFVHEDAGVRSLHFDDSAVQSSMRVSEPFELDLSYTRTMMGFQLFNIEPGHILLVGLGGGSLSKYCYRRFPQAQITTLEINPDVIRLRDEFLIPADNDRFRVIQADACDYLARGGVQADIILLDGYDAAGLPDCLCAEPFYANCWQALSSQGVLVTNLCGLEPNRTTYLDRMNRIFDGRVWWSKPRESNSLIVFAVKSAHYYPHWFQLTSAAQDLDARYRLDLLQVVKDMRQRLDPDDQSCYQG